MDPLITLTIGRTAFVMVKQDIDEFAYPQMPLLERMILLT